MKRSEYEREVIVRIFQVSNALQTHIDKILKDFNITAKQFFIMIIIGTFDEDPSIKDISERFESSHQNVKQILIKLEKQGLIKLYKDTNDSRILRTRFTNEADAFWKKRELDDYQIMAEIFSDLSLDNLSVFQNSLVKTLEKLNILNK
jgi:DNA-binding MarR family transcriptional regulator